MEEPINRYKAWTRWSRSPLDRMNRHLGITGTRNCWQFMPSGRLLWGGQTTTIECNSICRWTQVRYATWRVFLRERLLRTHQRHKLFMINTTSIQFCPHSNQSFVIWSPVALANYMTFVYDDDEPRWQCPRAIAAPQNRMTRNSSVAYDVL